jgi:cyclophilin-like protein
VASLTQQQKFNMEIKRIGSQPTLKGSAEWFTGTVRLDPLFQADEPARTSGANVTFEPGARTAWHIHPLGRTLIVTAGCGWVQREGRANRGGPSRRCDLVRARREALHGAAPTTAMTHIALAPAFFHAVCGADNRPPKLPTETAPLRPESMKLRLKVKDRVITATLIDCKTTRDFISLLPLTVTTNDLFRREKYAHLPRAIS